ncbi:2-polyprenyl-6-methoxyphenol hydroxylase [hydrothermal vent metagenome]|uniref:2-polyprenyl-6-methoxyphenol hydroxylase n=1 Tax=hydrothermal vent metagenome TaxID=652676 RepID=A0A3B0R625_9ZZZZ
MSIALQNPDVLIAGGGLVGLTTALALDSANLTVAVVDPLAFESQLAKQFDGRSCAISFANMRMLDVLGIKTRLRDNIGPINEILVSDGRAPDGLRTGGPGPMLLHFDRDELDGDDSGEPLGWMVENRYMRKALLDEIRARGSIQLIAQTTISQTSASPGGWDVQLANGQQIKPDLLIGAEGRNSPLRKMAGIRTHSYGYEQWGVVATIHHEQAHRGIAHEYFLPNGPFAILPLSGNRSSLVWTEKPASAQFLKTCDADFFQAELERRFGTFLGELTPSGPRWAYPLTLLAVEKYTADALVLVGDAAHGMHPIAGQGFNAGIRDAAVLADVLAETVRNGLRPRDGTALKSYQQRRRFDNASLLAATDAFVRLFSNDIPPVRHLRGLGMGLVDAIGPARRFFAKEAGGGIGPLPNLLRGELP